jgi:glycosyltransferase involved in cell wall biosynthesis
MENKLLTVLIPAFNSYEGVVRIVEMLKARENVGVIVSDDSNDSLVAAAIESYIWKLGRSDFTYCKHETTKNPVDNWNFLLAKVKSKFFMVAHHDESFSNTLFVDFLDKYQDTTGLMVLPISVKHPKSVVRTVSSRMQLVVVKLFRNNGLILNFVMGPCSLLVIKTDHLVYFNRDLVFYVDVEWYRRIFAKLGNENITFFSKTTVISIISDNSITKGIGNRMREVVEADLKILGNLYPNNVMLRKSMVGSFYKALYKFIILPSFIPYYIRLILSSLHGNNSRE